jgi:DNA-binding PadR family transcriptional regulator
MVHIVAICYSNRAFWRSLTATGTAISEVDQRTDGLIVLRTGKLYTVLKRLLEPDLVEESDKRPAPDEDDERRRYYRVTAFGRAVTEAEARRLEAAIAARRRASPRAARPVHRVREVQ